LNPLYFRYTFHCALGSTWAANHSCILRTLLNWNTSATELAQKKNLLRKWKSIVLAILSILAVQRRAKFEHVCNLSPPPHKPTFPQLWPSHPAPLHKSNCIHFRIVIWTLTRQVQSVILPLYFSQCFGIRVGHESLLHLDFDLANSIRYTSVMLFTARWDPRGPRITLSS
jgi:hypothetical protein